MPKLSFQYVRQGPSETLIQFLTRRFPYHTPVEWRARIQEGLVKIDDHPAREETVLDTGRKILYEKPTGPEPSVDGSYKILYEDESLIAVSKSGNIPTSPSGKYWDNCLVHLIKKNENFNNLHAVHRLDRETSGINLFAKDSKMAGKLGAIFTDGTVIKKYTAILKGKNFPAESYVSAPLLDQKGGQVRIKQAVDLQGKPAKTRFKMLKELEKGTLVEVFLYSGRTHQIRAHAAFLGHPVWGDKLYGVPEEQFIEWVSKTDRKNDDRHLLHATYLSFRHPVQQKEIVIEDHYGGILDLYKNQFSNG